MDIRFWCNTCGKTFTKSAKRITEHCFCSKDCYWEFRRKNPELFSKKGKVYDRSQLNKLKELEKEYKKNERKEETFRD